MRRGRGSLAPLALGAIALTVSCRRAPPPSAAAVEAGPPASDAEPAPAAAVLPPRCKPLDPGLAVGDPKADPQDLELGDAVFTPSGIAVGVVHRTPAGRVAAVALLAPDASSVRLRELAPTLGDAPPPRLAARGAGVLAVAYGLAKRPAGARALDVYAVSASGDVALTGSIDEAPDDSLVFDVSPDRVVWDEATRGAAPARAGGAAGAVGAVAPPAAEPRGVIRVAEISADGRPSAPRDASPPASDADTPRIVATPNGTLVFWIARRPEAPHAGDAAAPPEPAANEITGEARAFAWLEVARLDGGGAAASAARRLTPATGHVSAYDVAVVAGGGAPGVAVVARDEGEAIDGSGGSLLRVRVGVADGPSEAPLAYPVEDLGRGAPSFVEGDALWLAWTGPREEGRLLPLDPAAMPLAHPSAEPALDEGRALVSFPSPASPSPLPGDASHRLLVATPGDATAQLRLLTCTH
jgi:hypothetical protein